MTFYCFYVCTFLYSYPGKNTGEGFLSYFVSDVFHEKSSLSRF